MSLSGPVFSEKALSARDREKGNEEKMRIRLIASDLDNTLLTNDKRVTDRTRRALDEAAAKGILFVPATGRIFSGMPEEIRSIPYLCYAITGNGSSVLESATGKVLHQAEIPCGEAVRLARFMRQYGTWYDCYLKEQGYVEEFYYRQIDTYCLGVYRSMVRATRIPVKDLAECIQEKGAVQMMQRLFTEMALRESARREVAEAFPDILVVSSMENNAEFNWKTANKGDALLVLCEHLGIDPSETVAFGDGENDVTMLEAAGIGVAMKNSCEEALRAADFVTRGNEEDGVADFLEKYIL